MKLLIFQKINFNYIYFVLYLVTCLITTYIEQFGDTEEEEEPNNKNKSSKEKGHFLETISTIVLSLSDFLAIIPYYIKSYLSKRVEDKSKILIPDNDDTSSRVNSTYIYTNIYQDELSKKSTNLRFYTFLIGFLDFLVDILYYLYYLDNDVVLDSYYYVMNSSVVFQILMQYIIDVVILKSNFYRHHYLSIFMNFISFVILFFFDMFFFVEIFSKSWLLIIIHSFAMIFLVIENSYGKKSMVFGYISPFTLLIYKGIYKIFLMIIFYMFFIPIMAAVESNFLIDINNIGGFQIFMIILNFFATFLKNLFNWILIDRFSPSHLALSLIFQDISYIMVYFYMTVNEDGGKEELPLWNILIRIFIYIILFIATLIHNEIVVITKWGLGENTKLFLDEKVKEEMLLSNLETDENVLKRYDTMIEMKLTYNNENEEVENIDSDEDENDDKEK